MMTHLRVMQSCSCLPPDAASTHCLGLPHSVQAFASDGTLDRLEVAFSRAQAHKVYVQHLMQQHATELHALIAK